MLMGVIGAILRFYDYSPAPLLIGFVLGPMLEEHLRRALMISGGDFGYLLGSSTAIAIHCITILIIVLPLLNLIWSRIKRKNEKPVAD